MSTIYTFGYVVFEYFLQLPLITHGKHYDEFTKKIEGYIQQGYAITYSEPLVHTSEIVKMIKEKYLFNKVDCK